MTDERWQRMSLAAQLMNVGSEVSRFRSLSRTGDAESADRALCRALDLMDATVRVAHGLHRKRELLRIRSFLAQALEYPAEAAEPLQTVEAEFAPFAARVAMERGV